jgi:hypothetical protein
VVDGACAPHDRDSDAARRSIGAEARLGAGPRDDRRGVDDLPAPRRAQTVGAQLPVDACDRDSDRSGARM